LQEEVETLEGLVRDRSEDIMNLKESLWTRDESDRELKEGIREAKEQIDMMGNISVGVFDEEELKRLLAERDQKNSEETLRFRTVELELRQELEEVKMKHEGLEVQKARLEEQLQEVNQQLSTRNEEHATLKSELEAQWGHTESAGDKIQTLEMGLVELAQERDSLKLELDELEARTANMEVDWNESENKRNELEAELQEVWNLKDALEKDRGEVRFLSVIVTSLLSDLGVTSSRIPCIKNENTQTSWLIKFRSAIPESPNSSRSNNLQTTIPPVSSRIYTSGMRSSLNIPVASSNENPRSSTSAKK